MRGSSGLIEKVARALGYDDNDWPGHTHEAKAAIAMVLKDMDLWETDNCSSFHARDYARENGVSLDD